MKQLVQSAISGTPLDAAAIAVLGYFRNRQAVRRFWKWTEEDQKRAKFYRQFIGPSDLVFDVGANMGNRSKIFSKLGASVIAIEPQAHCVDFLTRAFSRTTGFQLIEKALGASVGETDMLISNASTISSLSPEWVRSVQESGRFSEFRWDQTQNVEIETLDNLIHLYGLPTFVKIDVEGYEDRVISGLTRAVKSLSLEFTAEFMESTYKCIDHLLSIDDADFQISIGESMKFALPDWVDAHSIREELSKYEATRVFGDLYVRFRQRLKRSL